MEICQKLSDHELKRVCKDATQKAIHQYFNSSVSRTPTSCRPARTKKTYKALLLVLLSLWICSSLYCWRSCGHIKQEESTPQELTAPVEPQFCAAKTEFPKIDWRGMANWKEERKLFLWKLVERYNQKETGNSKSKIVKWHIPKNWRRRVLRTPWDGPFLTLAEGVYDRALSLIPYRAKSKIEEQDESLS